MQQVMLSLSIMGTCLAVPRERGPILLARQSVLGKNASQMLLRGVTRIQRARTSIGLAASMTTP